MSSQRNHGIQLRLILGFAVAPLIMIVLSIIGITQVNGINQSLTTINDVNSVKQRFAINFRGSVHDRAISLRDVILNNNPQEIQNSIAEIQKLAGFYVESATPLDKIFNEQKVTSEEVSLLQDIKAIENQTLPLIDKAIEAKLSGKDELAWQTLMVEAKPAFITWLSRINKFIDYQERMNGLESKVARESASGFQLMMMVLTLLSTLITIALAYFIIRSIIRSLLSVASELDSSSNQITLVSETISESSRTLAEGSKNQAQAIDSISHSLKEMNTTIQLSADNSLNAARLASESKASAATGETVVKQMHQAIVDIKTSNTTIMTQIDESNSRITEIVNLIREIGEKTKVIDDIVFQTKLLSFNASVEAARAGEAGKGFAVVAEEVGNLAQMSGRASKEIADMLNISRQKVENIVTDTRTKVSSLIESGQSKVEVGIRIANQCAEVLQDIVRKVTDVTRMAEDISRAATEQNVGFKLITSNVVEMDEVTQRNAQVASETSETLQALNSQALEMRRAFENLSELIDRDIKKVA